MSQSAGAVSVMQLCKHSKSEHYRAAILTGKIKTDIKQRTAEWMDGWPPGRGGGGQPETTWTNN